MPPFRATSPRSVFLSTGQLDYRVGVTYTAVGGARARPVISFAASQNYYAGGAYEIPDWPLTNVELFLANLGAGAGDVRFMLRHSPLADDADIGAAQTFTAGFLFTASAQNIVFSAVIESVALPSVGHLTVERNGTGTGDTLANAVGLLGVRLTPA